MRKLAEVVAVGLVQGIIGVFAAYSIDGVVKDETLKGWAIVLVWFAVILVGGGYFIARAWRVAPSERAGVYRPTEPSGGDAYQPRRDDPVGLLRQQLEAIAIEMHKWENAQAASGRPVSPREAIAPDVDALLGTWQSDRRALDDVLGLLTPEELFSSLRGMTGAQIAETTSSLIGRQITVRNRPVDQVNGNGGFVVTFKDQYEPVIFMHFAIEWKARLLRLRPGDLISVTGTIMRITHQQIEMNDCALRSDQLEGRGEGM